MPDKSHSMVHLTAGTITTDWCDRCLLPSILVVPLHIVSESGVRHVATYRKCEDCPEEDR